MSQSRTAKYIVTELKMPEAKKKIDAEYSRFAKRILWLDDQVVEQERSKLGRKVE